MNQYLVKGRRQELDWLRALAVLVLVFYHTGLLYGPWTWYIKNPETNETYAYWMAFLHSWRMPLLFFISGAGTFFAFRKLNTYQFIVERVKRLIVPLIFGIVVILPPQDYYQHIQEYDNYWEFYKTVLDYIPFYNGGANLHHLWFLSNLFIVSLLGIPVIILCVLGILILRCPGSLTFIKPVVLLTPPI
jgi:peptidoglycan/LPS O-acetylase OafA/YrhL